MLTTEEIQAAREQIDRVHRAHQKILHILDTESSGHIPDPDELQGLRDRAGEVHPALAKLVASLLGAHKAVGSKAKRKPKRGK